jgi:site-specific DNA recombinase
MMRCGVYLRFSSDVQHPASIDDQLLACERYAERHGWILLADHRYVDQALSGTGVEHRPGYRRLLAGLAAPTRPFDIILVDDLSRLSRDAGEILRLVRQLQGAGIKLISVADGIETGTKLAKLALSVKAVINELYLDDLRDRTLRGLAGRFARGLHTGGRIYGYRSRPVLDPGGRVDGMGQPLVLGHALEIDPIEARIVRLIFEWFGGGLSLRACAQRLTAQAIPFPAQPTRRGPSRQGWGSSAVRVILRNEKYWGRWIWGRRCFVKDPVTGRRAARLRPAADWQEMDRPELRIVSDLYWAAVQTRFTHLAVLYPRARARGRLEGRAAGSPCGRATLFSGLLRCGICGGALVVINGDGGRPERRRYGCGRHRDKGSSVCANALTVKIGTVESRLVAAMQARVLHPDAIGYVVERVNRHLGAAVTHRHVERAHVERELHRIDGELAHIERAIVQGIVGETTAALLRDREARRTALRARLEALGARTTPTLNVEATTVQSALAELQSLLQTDAARANGVFRTYLGPITCMPMEVNGRRFYRAQGVANGPEMLKRLGLTQAFDLGGCGGWI